LFQFAQVNQSSGTSLSLVEQALLQKLEEEALALQLAAKQGIAITEQDITNQIGATLGVPVGGSGSSFDTLYRQKLKDLKMSDGNYRRLTKAQIANDRLLLAYEAEIGSAGETISLRAVLSPTKEAAEAIVARIKGGEDMGTVAQKDSTDLESRQKDGLLDPTSQALLPEAARKALEGKSDGELIGPVEVEGNFWVLRVEKRDPEGALTTAQTTDLAKLKLDDAIDALRLTSKIKRSLDPSDIKWAENHIE
jgi:parvulin-like peptidyl-prolyl isomerase